VLSTVRSSSGGSGEGRLGVEVIPAREGRGWTGSGRGARGGGEGAVGRGDLVGVKGLRRIPAKKARRTSVAQGGRKGEVGRGKGFGLSL
jgi:hypothetical protein